MPRLIGQKQPKNQTPPPQINSLRTLAPEESVVSALLDKGLISIDWYWTVALNEMRIDRILVIVFPSTFKSIYLIHMV